MIFFKWQLHSYFLACGQRRNMDVKIEPGWKEVLKDEFNKPYFQNIVLHLKTEKSQGKVIYPPGSFIFNAFKIAH